MNFKFSLQRVLEMREEHMRECEIELERARNVVVKLRALLTSERDIYFDEREELNASLQNSDLSKVSMYDGSLESRKKRMIQILENLKVAQSEVELAEQTLIQARRNLKVLENLRDKKLAEFNLAQDKHERKLLDEHANRRFARLEYLDKKARES